MTRRLWWLGAPLLLALASLAAARYIESPHWVDALIATGGFLGLAAATGLGLVVRRVAPRVHRSVAALILASGAAVGRDTLLKELAARPPDAPAIDFFPIALACSTVVWGAVALLWGTLAITDAVERAPLRARSRAVRSASRSGGSGRKRFDVVVGGAAVALALFSVTPLWALLGMAVNHWTLLGLFGLACVAYLVGRLYTWFLEGNRA